MDAVTIATLLERFRKEYTVFALRVAGTRKIRAGQALAPSRRWWEGDPVFVHRWIREEEAAQYEAEGYTVYRDRDEWCYHNLAYLLESDDDLLLAVHEEQYVMEAGTCGIHVTPDNVEEALKLIAKYEGEQYILMAGHSGEKGYDKGEMVIPEARALAVWPVSVG